MSDEEMESSDVDSGSDEEMEKVLEEVNCLFCQTISYSVGESAQHCIQEHSFDIRSYISKRVASHYDLVKVITYLRKHKPTTKELEAIGENKPWASDEYLLPVSSNDPWLWADDGLVPGADDDDDIEPKYVNAENGLVTLSKEHFDQLHEKNQRLEDLFREQERKIAGLKKLLREKIESEDQEIVNDSSSYFASYADFDIHREMLKDSPRMMAYKKTINPILFTDKLVLDIGCGTGIMSMLAASNGAKKVIAVENSDIFDTAVEIVRDNGLDSKITLIKGDIEKIELDYKFDIIVSEWMGYFLLFEGMIDSIIMARDKFLKEDGYLFPSGCTIWLAGCSDPETYAERTNCEFLGYKMEPLKRAALSEPAVELVPAYKLVTEPTRVHRMILDDRNSVRTDNCRSFTSEFVFKVNKDCELTSVCGWFDCEFSPTFSTLSTSPYSDNTHWAQTNFYFQKPLKVTADSSVVGKISVAPRGKRALDVTLEFPAFDEKRVYTLH